MTEPMLSQETVAAKSLGEPKRQIATQAAQKGSGLSCFIFAYGPSGACMYLVVVHAPSLYSEVLPSAWLSYHSG